MSERDEELSRIYAESRIGESGDGPPAHLDDAIRAASRRAVGAGPRARPARRWGPPVALAATVLLTATVSLLVFQKQSDTDSRQDAAPAMQREAKPAAPAATEAPTTPPSRPTAGAQRERREAPRDAPPKADVPAQPAFVPEPPAASDAQRSDERRENVAPVQRRSAPAEAEAYRQAVPQAAPAPAPVQQAVPAPASPPPPPPLAKPAAAGPPAAAARSAQKGLEAASGARQARDALARTPEEWIDAMRRLKAQARIEDLQRELAEFRRQYPDYPLPADLRQP